MGDQPGLPHRLFGGAPLGVILRLLIVSVIIGAILAGLGLTPDNILQQVAEAVRYVWYYGFDGARHVGAYALMGAVIVVPVWLLMRMAGRG